VDIVEISKEAVLHPDEWLLFEVTETTSDDVPLKGRLLCHSRSRDEVHEVAMQNLGKDLLTSFAGDPVPADLYVVL
jgi:hypothetical protein